ncbi:hypothetical protein BGZ94_009782, partial [Podila epigama]
MFKSQRNPPSNGSGSCESVFQPAQTAIPDPFSLTQSSSQKRIDGYFGPSSGKPSLQQRKPNPNNMQKSQYFSEDHDMLDKELLQMDDSFFSEADMMDGDVVAQTERLQLQAVPNASPGERWSMPAPQTALRKDIRFDPRKP